MSQAAAQATAFYREVASNQRVWTIRDKDGVPTPENADGQRAMPFWSSESRVRSFLEVATAYGSFEPVAIEWADFVNRWAPGLERDGLRAGVNWSGSRATGYDIEPGDLLRNVAAST